jgi:hypothetical protein
MATIDFSPLLSMKQCRLVPPPPLRPTQNKRRLLTVLARLAALDAESLLLYRPLPEAARFHASTAKIRLGEGSNRSSKTMALVVELVRALMGIDPYGKYPPRNGVAMLVGLKEDNIALLWRRIAEPDCFKLVRDEHTKLLRAVRPDPNDPLHLDPYDLAYQEKWQDAPPLLPSRVLPPHSIAWSDFGKGVPRTVKIPSTGWRLELRPSGSRPDQGDHYNLACNDEEMEKTGWYSEEIRGLAGTHESPEHSPKLIWNGTSQVANPDFAEMRDKAMSGVPGYERFVFLIKDNPYISDIEKLALYNGWPESERDTRWHGIPAIIARRIYGNYEPMGMHGCEPFDLDDEWTRYAIVDPGTDMCATLLMAIDPDEQHAWVYGGFILRNASAVQWAYKLKEWERGIKFEAVYLDSRAGSQRSLNAAETTAKRFWDAMETAEVEPRTYGSLQGFFPGNPDVEARTMALRGWLEPRPDGPFAGLPTLQVMKGVLPELDKQIKEAISDRKNPAKRAKIEGHPCDILDCIEYAASGHLRYHEVETVTSATVPFAVESFKAMKKKHALRYQQAGALLG